MSDTLPNFIEFDKETLEKLRNLYLKALENGESSFMFEDRELFTGYAKYMLEYLDSKFYPTK